MQTAKCERCGREENFETYKYDWPEGWKLTGKSKHGKRYHRQSGFAWWCPDCQESEKRTPLLPIPALRALGLENEEGEDSMKTITTTRIVSELDNLQFGYWRQINEEDGEFVPLRSMDDFATAAEHLGCSTDLLDTLHILHDNLLDAIKADLVDIWERLERAPVSWDKEQP